MGVAGVTFLEFLDRRSVRRHQRIMARPNPKDRPRLFVTAGLFVLFGYVLYHNVSNEMLIGAIIGSFGTGIMFWLGSSKGSSDKSEQLALQAEGPAGTESDPLVIEGAPEGEAVTTKPRSKSGV